MSNRRFNIHRSRIALERLEPRLLLSAAPSYPFGFSAAGLTLNGGATIVGTKLRLTDSLLNEARSAFYSTPVNVQSFVTSFSFQMTNAMADGIAFVIQGNGPTALGASGMNLGYGGNVGFTTTPLIPKSVAVKFDTYDNVGEGTDSTGLFTNGATPTEPGAIKLDTTGIVLRSGDVFDVVMVYNGTTLAVTIIDTSTNVSASQSYTVNIPSIVGGNTAYVGLTGATGGQVSTQDILNWEYDAGLADQAYPTIAIQASASPSPTNGATTLSVLGGDATKEPSLTYTWSAFSVPAGAAIPTFSVNGTNAAKNTATTLSKAGAYTFLVTAYDGTLTAVSTVTVIDDPTLPTISAARPASASPSPVTGTDTALDVLGADTSGEARLTYTWTATNLPAGAPPPTFSINGTNAAKDTTATFQEAGAYTFRVTMSDGAASTTSSVNVIVDQTLTTIALSPSVAVLEVNGRQQFSATGYDQFARPMPSAAFTWSVEDGGIGTISATGLYTAPASEPGSATVRVAGGAASAIAKVTVLRPPTEPASTSPVPEIPPTPTAPPTYDLTPEDGNLPGSAPVPADVGPALNVPPRQDNVPLTVAARAVAASARVTAQHAESWHSPEQTPDTSDGGQQPSTDDGASTTPQPTVTDPAPTHGSSDTVRPTPIVSPSSPLSGRPSDALLSQLNWMGQQFDRERRSTVMVVGAAGGLTSLVSVGYVLWAVRGGSLIGSLLAALPLWRWLDPLPILEFPGRDVERRRKEADRPDKPKDQDEQRLESLLR